jgi:hypothetical protein
MPEIRTNTWPHNGWTFIEPLTGWQAPNPLVDNFERTVQRIVEHRMNNRQSRKAPDPGLARADLLAFTAHRLPIQQLNNVTPNNPTAGCAACGKS